MTEIRMVLMEAIARKRVVTVRYNGIDIALAPHLLFDRRGDLHLAALNLTKAWRSDEDPRLGVFKLGGITAATIGDAGFDPLPSFAGIAPTDADIAILAV
ncbi:MAG: hypothetical protein RLZZ58_1432 [Pseudomonadota bacterium]